MGSVIVITGATGFVGSHILRLLSLRNEKVRVLIRRDSPTHNLRCASLEPEITYGDLRDKGSLRDALKGCKILYHAAASYTLWTRNIRDIYDTNVQGTINLLEAAKEEGLEKIIYTSTVGTIGIPNNGKPGNEETPVSLSDMVGHYKRSKFLAEQEVLKFVKQGLPVVIVNPTTPVGSMDIKPTPTGKMLVDFLNRRMVGYIETGLNIIDVEDVAAGHILACERGRIGNRYILGNKNMSLLEIFEALSKIAGIKAPCHKIPYAFALAFGYLNTLFSYISGLSPQIPLEGVRMAKRFMYFDSSKAVNELGLPQSPVDTALTKAVNWFKEHGYIKR